MPQIIQVYRDKILTNASVKYTNAQNFIADTVAPVLTVDQKTGYYFVYDRSNLRKPPSSKVAGRSLTPEIDYGLTQVPYGPLTRRRLKKFLSEDELNMTVTPADAEQDTTEFLTEQLALEREIDLAADMVNSAIVTNNVTLSGSSQWSDYTTNVSLSNPITAIKNKITAMKLAGLIAPNVAVMGQQVWDAISEHPSVVDRIKYTSDQAVAAQVFARLVGLENVIIGSSVYDTTFEGASSPANAFIWGKHCWLMRLAKTPGLKNVSAFYQLALKGAREVHKWDVMDPVGRYVRVNDYYDRKLMAAEGIYGIFNAVA